MVQKRLFFTLIFLFSEIQNAQAQVIGPQIGHPLILAHDLPRSQSPGWRTEQWIQIEFGESNVWGIPLTVRHNETNETLHYFSDFETSHLIINYGKQISKLNAIEFELLGQARASGAMDQPIDWYHKTMGFSRYQRPNYSYENSDYEISAAGRENFDRGPSADISSIKISLKHWLLGGLDTSTRVDQAGISLSAQVKVPLTTAGKGLSSGAFDYSIALYSGFKPAKQTALGLTIAASYLPSNEMLRGFPRKTSVQGVYLTSQWGLGESWHLLANLNCYSNFIRGDLVTRIDPENDPNEKHKNRVASGWNSLMHWNWYEQVGVEYAPDEKSRYRLYGIEDFTLGNVDGSNDPNYVSNSPDFELVFQYSYAL